MKSPKPQTEPTEQNAAPSVPPTTDVALIHGVTSDGSVQVIRRRGDKLEAGSLQPLREGAPIRGEVVSLRPRESCPLLCDVDVLYAPSPSTEAATATPSSRRHARRKGPAQVATDTYRDNWDSIWSTKKNETLN